MPISRLCFDLLGIYTRQGVPQILKMKVIYPNNLTLITIFAVSINVNKCMEMVNKYLYETDCIEYMIQ